MAYTKADWVKRVRGRVDYSARLTHLTRSSDVDGGKGDALDVLIQILRDRRLKASTTNSGFIVGPQAAVCFQDAPLYSVCENINFEIELKAAKKLRKIRYEPYGLAFLKPYVFGKGGRPVIYDKTEDAKEYLPEGQWWRIVNYDLSNEDRYIDWTHEREWRVPGDMDFDLDQVTVLLPNAKKFQQFYKRSKIDGEDISNEVACVVPLGVIFL
jgi:hypothetical protein